MSEQIAFYGLATMIVLSSLNVILLNNPIYNVLFLVMAFIGSAGLYLILKAEFLAMMLVIIYVGAIAVFFLFTVMTIDGMAHKKGEGMSLKKKILTFILGLIFMMELSFVIILKKGTLDVFSCSSSPKNFDLKHLAILIFKENGHLLELTGILLLVAMIGAIVITQHNMPIREPLKKQNVQHQNSRSREDSIKLTKVEFGKGIK